MNQLDPITDANPLTHLLKQAALLKDKIDALASASGESFNIFTILDRETDEVKTHSAMIADLLNPGAYTVRAQFLPVCFSRNWKLRLTICAPLG